MPVFINRHKGSGGVVLKPGDELYTIMIDQSVDDPSDMITYEDMCKGYTPAHHDYSTEGFKETLGFDSGSFVDAFFMKVRPCMLKWDGTVDYYLDPNDYTKRSDGTASDNSDLNYQGNAMVEFPKAYLRFEQIGEKKNRVSVSNRKLDKNFHCYSHESTVGTEIPYTYYSIYEGLYLKNTAADVSSVRSLARSTDTSTANGQVRTGEYTMVMNNNRDSRIMWLPMAVCDRVLINTLLLVIGKSFDIRSVFGYGYIGNINSTTTSVKFKTGLGDKKGLFYGCNHPYFNATYNNLTKVFGIERYYGGCDKRIWGSMIPNDTKGHRMAVKYHYGGFTENGYDSTNVSDHDIELTTIPPVGAKGDVSEMNIGEYGYIPKAVKTGGIMGYYEDERYIGSDIYLPVNHGPLGMGTRSWSRAKFFSSLACKPYAA